MEIGAIGGEEDAWFESEEEELEVDAIGKGDGKCRRCGGKGHFARECSTSTGKGIEGGKVIPARAAMAGVTMAKAIRDMARSVAAKLPGQGNTTAIPNPGPNHRHGEKARARAIKAHVLYVER